MDSSVKKINWHLETIPTPTKKALDFLSRKKWLSKSWYLAGGTALALQVGHRQSYDLDFFNPQKSFDERKLLTHFLGNQDWLTNIKEENTVYGELFKARVSFIAHPFFIPKQKPLWYGSIRILNKIDIAVMKITAIAQRGRKRDFFDLYWCAKNIVPLEKLIKRLKAQYPSVTHDYHHILKALVYFADAENDPNPQIYFKADWRGVKNFFLKEIPIITGKLI